MSEGAPEAAEKKGKNFIQNKYNAITSNGMINIKKFGHQKVVTMHTKSLILLYNSINQLESVHK